MTTIRFDLTFFASLGCLEGNARWQEICLGDLESDEAFLVAQFLELITGEKSFAPETGVLLAKFAPGGVIEQVYGPCLFAAPEGAATGRPVILKVGSLEIPVAIADKEVVVGKLCGQFVSRSSRSQLLEEGKEKEVFTELVLYSEQLDTKYIVGAKFSDKGVPSDARLNALLKKGDLGAIATYLKAPSGGGNPALKLKELEVGEYALTGFRPVETQYGTAYILSLGGGIEAWAAGNVLRILRVQSQRQKIEAGLAAGRPWTLKIAQIDWVGDRARVTCGLYPREPHCETKKKALAAAPAAPFVANGNGKGDGKKMVTLNVAAVASASSDDGDDDIPF